METKKIKAIKLYFIYTIQYMCIILINYISGINGLLIDIVEYDVTSC